MDASTRTPNRSTVALKALPLSRQATLLILLIAAAFWGAVSLLWVQVGLDKWLLLSQEGLGSNDVLVACAQLASKFGMPMIVMVYLLYFLGGFKYEELRDVYPIYLVVLLTFGIAAVAGDVLKEILNRPRPFLEYAGQITAFSTASTPAFPSGHATKSTALALPFLLLIVAKGNWHKWAKVLMAIIALGVCYSRVLLGAHYVSDVLAGVGMALACFPLATVLSNIALRRMSRQRLNSAIRVWAIVLVALMVYLVSL